MRYVDCKVADHFADVGKMVRRSSKPIDYFACPLCLLSHRAEQQSQKFNIGFFENSRVENL